MLNLMLFYINKPRVPEEGSIDEYIACPACVFFVGNHSVEPQLCHKYSPSGGLQKQLSEVYMVIYYDTLQEGDKKKGSHASLSMHNAAVAAPRKSS